MSTDKRRISISDLPDNASAALKAEDVQDTEGVTGGATRIGARTSIRVGKRAGIRNIRKLNGIRKIVSGDSWLQK
tara:strand:- start:175 stop:399 length:225 start_codon:yes stop_codon:yes gene_type:complete